MKRLTIITLLFMSAVLSVQAQADLRKRIEVNGKAEREIMPDKITLQITLREYKDGSKIIPMDKLESGLVKAVKNAGIPDDKLTVSNIYGYNWDWRKKRTDDFLTSKSFNLEISDVKMMNNLIEDLDPEGVQNISVMELTHTKIDEIKDELRTKALLNAKAKATSLLAAIGETLGGAMEINETEQYNQTPYRVQSMAMKSADVQQESYESNLELKTIKIVMDVRAVFEIK